MKTPLALFTYNRPDHVRLALEAILRCRRLSECAVYIYCDGPAAAGLLPSVTASRAVVHEWADRLDARVIERDQNLGLARSIFAGVSELCEKFGRVIVLEDDFIASPDFLEYMLSALDRYENEPSVYQVSAYVFPIRVPRGLDTFFLPVTTTRGWGTWWRAWKRFDWECKGAAQLLEDGDTRRRFNLDDSFSYSRLLSDCVSGRRQSWGVRWWWCVFRNSGLVLYPRRPLVWVGGWDGSGTNCAGKQDFDQGHASLFRQPQMPTPIRLPAEIHTNEDAFRRVKQLLKRRSTGRKPVFSGWRRALSRIKRTMRIQAGHAVDMFPTPGL